MCDQVRLVGSPARASAALISLLLVIWEGALLSAQAPGPTVWDGIFTEAQADRGRLSFLEHCSSCHGSDLGGGLEGRPLTGDGFWNSWRENTVDVLLERVSTNMPYSMDGSLEGTLPLDTYEDIVAYILAHNGFPPGDEELTRDSSLGVQIIAEDGPGELPASTLANVVGCLARGDDGGWRVVRATDPVRAEADAPESPESVPLGDREFALMFVLTPLDAYEGHRVVARGLLIGEGGVDGLNVSIVTSAADVCR